MVGFAAMASLGSQSKKAPANKRPADWQASIADAVRDPAELCRLLKLDPSLAVEATRHAKESCLMVPRDFLARIQPGDPSDPLLLQVLPQAAERIAAADFRTDPLGEAQATVAPGLLRKYRGRSLIVTTGGCAVHCRFCFRRHFPYETIPQRCGDWKPALQRIAAEKSIHEVILSGGDPLTLPDVQLAALAGHLAEIPHVKRLRVHTRVPVMIPSRVTDELIAWLRGTRLTPIVVVHVNHPAELDDSVTAALSRLIDGGITVLNQSVLLRRVNDNVEVLVELCERLIGLGVMPYYLHQLDRVAGVTHFEVPIATGIELIEQLRTRLPGYAVPRYVRETPGAGCKQPLA